MLRFLTAGESHGKALVELLTVALAVGLYLQFGLTWRWAIYTILAFALVILTFVDLSHRIIPDEITKPGIVLGLIASALLPSLHGATSHLQGFLHGALGALVGGGSLYLTGLLGDWLFKKESMGGGNVKLLAMAGAVLGWQRAVLTFFLAPILIVIPSLIIRLRRKGSFTIEYGPFLAAAILISVMWGSHILRVLHL